MNLKAYINPLHTYYYPFTSVLIPKFEFHYYQFCYLIN